jgi:translin
MSLREILREIKDELTRKDTIRQEIQKATRKATQLSKQAIFQVHKNELNKAQNILKEAKITLYKYNDSNTNYLNLPIGNMAAAFEEYSEACILLNLVTKGIFISHKEINVPLISYVLGLGDVVGELRRLALDSLRRGETKKAEDFLKMMEKIYEELINLDEIQFLINGLRRKCDIARKLIEITRGDVTIEIRRNILKNSISKITKKLGADKLSENS